MVYKFFDKMSSGSRIAIKPNYELANEFHKQIIRKLKKKTKKLSFKHHLEKIFGVLI